MTTAAEQHFKKGLWVTQLTYIGKLARFLAPNSQVEGYTKEDHVAFYNKEPSIILMNHNEPASWMPALTLMVRETIKRIKLGISEDYKLFIIFHPKLYSVPIFSRILKRCSVKVTRKEDIAEVIKNNRTPMFLTCPEGDNCFFDFDGPIAPFRQFGLIKMAMQLGVKIMVCTAYEETKQSVSVKLPLIGLIRKGSKALRIPLIRPTKLLITYSHITPDINPSEFNALDANSQRVAVAAQADIIRELMIEHYDYLQAVHAGDAEMPRWK